MNKKGFTLIELLAVIVILVIIALIAVPIVLGVIEKSKIGAFKDSVMNAYGSVDYILLKKNQSKLDSNGIDIKDLKIKSNFKSGKFLKDANGYDIAYFISDDEFCAYGPINNLLISKSCKDFDKIPPKIDIIVKEGSSIEKEDYSEWYNSEKVKVEIKVEDYYKYNDNILKGGLGVKKENIEIKNNGIKAEVKNEDENIYEMELVSNGENKIEVKAEDNAGNIGTEVKIIKIDNIVPTIKVISNPLPLSNEDYDFKNNVEITYGPAGGNVICNPEKSLKTGTYDVMCSVVGNNDINTGEVGFSVTHSYSATCNWQCLATELVDTKENCSYSDGVCRWKDGHKSKCTNCWHKKAVCVSEGCKYSCPNGGYVSGNTCYY